MKPCQRSARGSSALRTPVATRLRIIDRPARENGWHGGAARDEVDARVIPQPSR